MALLETARDPDDEDRGAVHKLLAFPGALARWFWAREALRKSKGERTEPINRFRNICISREAGAGGGTIGRLVAARLGWKVFDQEIIDAIAKGMGITADEVKILDELSPSIAQDWILPLREEYYAPQEAYLDHLAKLIDAAGKAGGAVIIGRGANFHLPRSETLSVRIVAPLRFRAEHLAEVLHVTPRTGRRAAVDLDRRREKFVRVMYAADARDVHNYDFVLDSQSLGPVLAAELIARAVELGRMRSAELEAGSAADSQAPGSDRGALHEELPGEPHN